MSEGTTQQTYSVTGMTCAHCVATVAEEVGALPGVSGVDVDLDSGALVVSGSDVDGEAVRGAVEAAGYSLSATSVHLDGAQVTPTAGDSTCAASRTGARRPSTAA
jgi:copper chaperone